MSEETKQIIIDKEYRQTLFGNFIRNVTHDVAISYNPCAMLNLDSMPETAVIICGDPKSKYYIAYGDLRDKFNDCNTMSDVIGVCKELYKDPSLWCGFWSDNWEEIVGEGD